MEPRGTAGTLKCCPVHCLFVSRKEESDEDIGTDYRSSGVCAWVGDRAGRPADIDTRGDNSRHSGNTGDLLNCGRSGDGHGGDSCNTGRSGDSRHARGQGGR